MAITPQHQKGEPTEADLEKAYNRARSIGLFLVERYARETLRLTTGKYTEFMIDEDGVWGFVDKHETLHGWPHVFPLKRLMQLWDDKLGLTSEPMRFTATGPIRREW